AHGGDKVVFVGDTMGDGAQFWAEGARLTLPNSKLRVRYSSDFHDWGGPCTLSTCLWATRIFGPDHRISLEPDVRVPSTLADYVAGRDAALDRIQGQKGIRE